MKYHADIDAQQLRAMALLAATRDVRYYLQGVHIEASPDVLLVATDGTKLGVLRTGRQASAPFEVQVPHHVIKEFAKAKGDLQLTSDEDEKWTLANGAKAISWMWERAEYPDMRRVIPDKATGVPAQVNVTHLAAFRKVHETLGGSTRAVDAVLLSFSGPESGALVHLPYFPDFVGVLLPLRTPTEKNKVHPVRDIAPAWLRGTTCDLA